MQKYITRCLRFTCYFHLLRMDSTVHGTSPCKLCNFVLAQPNAVAKNGVYIKSNLTKVVINSFQMNAVGMRLRFFSHILFALFSSPTNLHYRSVNSILNEKLINTMPFEHICGKMLRFRIFSSVFHTFPCFLFNVHVDSSMFLSFAFFAFSVINVKITKN